MTEPGAEHGFCDHHLGRLLPVEWEGRLVVCVGIHVSLESSELQSSLAWKLLKSLLDVKGISPYIQELALRRREDSQLCTAIAVQVMDLAVQRSEVVFMESKK